jgi:hypothetical protein
LIFETFAKILVPHNLFMNAQSIANLGYAALGMAIVVVGMNHYFG